MEGCQKPFHSRKGCELFDIVGRHLPSVHSYADDTHLYLAFSPNVQSNDASAVKAMRDCTMDLRIRVIRVGLMLNDDKTEFLLFGTKQQLAKLTLVVSLLVSLL